jgi:hypothetical protein
MAALGADLDRHHDESENRASETQTLLEFPGDGSGTHSLPQPVTTTATEPTSGAANLAAEGALNAPAMQPASLSLPRRSSGAVRVVDEAPQTPQLQLNTTATPDHVVVGDQTLHAAEQSTGEGSGEPDHGPSTSTLLQHDHYTAPQVVGTHDPEAADDPKIVHKVSMWQKIKRPWNAFQQKKKFYGWKVSATLAAFLATATLGINIGILAWLNQQKSADDVFSADHQVPVFSGDCDTAAALQLWVHLGINILSSVLLGASNFSMQVLSAPIRREVDRAHAKGSYLDIGVQSPRNLFSIAPWRTVLWWVLLLSSIPLHLLYNSAFFQSSNARGYAVFAMTADWQSYTAADDISRNDVFDQDANSIAAEYLADLVQHPERLESLDPLKCLDAYARPMVSDRSNLILVTNNQTTAANGSPLLDHVFYNFLEAATQGSDNYKPYYWYTTGMSQRCDMKLTVAQDMWWVGKHVRLLASEQLGRMQRGHPQA